MSKDLLAEATRALRETEELSEIEARATRARVLSGLHQTRVRRRTRYAYLLPIAATFMAASAWGAASGKAQLVWASIERIAHVAPTPIAPTTSASAVGCSAASHLDRATELACSKRNGGSAFDREFAGSDAFELERCLGQRERATERDTNCRVVYRVEAGRSGGSYACAVSRRAHGALRGSRPGARFGRVGCLPGRCAKRRVRAGGSLQPRAQPGSPRA
jgi:hypothetical protein